MLDRRRHWDDVYASKPIDELGWYTPRLATSLHWIEGLNLEPDAPIIDVGCGVSTLVDDLLDTGFADITLLDISATAFAEIARRLRARFEQIDCIEADVTTAELPVARYALWHDRAVFHFLTDEEDRQRYKKALHSSLQPNGWFVIGAFSPAAPPTCSGLPVQRYDLQDMVAALAPELTLVDNKQQLHVTPGGVEQPYQYGLFRRSA